MKRCGWVKGFLGLALALLARAAEPSLRPATSWQTVELLENTVISARLLVLRDVSPADIEWAVLEIENRLGADYSTYDSRLDLTVEWTESDDPSRVVETADLMHDRAYEGVVRSDVVRVPLRVWPAPAYNSKQTQKPRLQIGARVRLALKTRHGEFESPERRVSSTWSWADPSDGFGVRTHIRRLLERPSDPDFHGEQLRAMLTLPGIADALSRDELLGLHRRHDMGPGGWTADQLDRRFPNDPMVVGYFNQCIATGDLGDLGSHILWKSQVVPVLVTQFEKTGSGLLLVYLSGPSRQAWAEDSEIVGRLSGALLRHRPVLRRDVLQLPASELYSWGLCASEAAIIPDKGLVRHLVAGLDDERMAIAPNEALRADLTFRRPVADYAMGAIAALLGVSLEKEYGLTMEWGSKGEGADRHREATLRPAAARLAAIADLKRRAAPLLKNSPRP